MTCLRKSKPLDVLDVMMIDYEECVILTKGNTHRISFDDILWLKSKKTL